MVPRSLLLLVPRCSGGRSSGHPREVLSRSRRRYRRIGVAIADGLDQTNGRGAEGAIIVADRHHIDPQLEADQIGRQIADHEVVRDPD